MTRQPRTSTSVTMPSRFGSGLSDEEEWALEHGYKEPYVERKQRVTWHFRWVPWIVVLLIALAIIAYAYRVFR